MKRAAGAVALLILAASQLEAGPAHIRPRAVSPVIAPLFKRIQPNRLGLNSTLFLLPQIQCSSTSQNGICPASGGGGGGAATAITEGTTTVSGGNNRVLYVDNVGVLGSEAAFAYTESTDTMSAVNVIGTTGVAAVGANGTANAVYLASNNVCFEGSAADGNDLCLSAVTVNTPATMNLTMGGSLTIDMSTGNLILGDIVLATQGVFTIRPIEAVTGAKTTTLNESMELYTNTGAAGAVTITLLNDPTAGATYSAWATVNQDLSFAPSAGETIQIGASTCTAVVMDDIGDSITLTAVTGGSGAVWGSIGSSGNPTCTP